MTSFGFFVEVSSSLSTDPEPGYTVASRGFLLQLLPLGCSPRAPALASARASLVTSNQTHAVYRCQVRGLQC